MKYEINKQDYEKLVKNAKEISYDLSWDGTATTKHQTKEGHILTITTNGDDYIPVHYYITIEEEK